MWHPGQLSAWNQHRLLEKSGERCVYVGYPGNFYKRDSLTYFRADFTSSRTFLLEVCSSGETEALLDGRPFSGKVRVGGGNHHMDITVRTHGRLPAVRIKGLDDALKVQSYQASLDGEMWLPVEYDPKQREGLLPDDDQETVREILPSDMFLISKEGFKPLASGSVHLQKGDTLLVDFHEIELGNVRFRAHGGERLRFIVGESRSEALDGREEVFEQRRIPDVQTEDGESVRLEERALRFLSVIPNGPCSLSDFVFEARMWPGEPQLTFHCDDEDLERLFDASVKTQLTSLHGGFSLDGVKRDFLPWAMDGVASSLSLDYLLSDRQVGRNGISVALLPPSPGKADIGVMDYPLHAFLGLEEDYLRYGDLSTWHMYRDRALTQAALYASLQDGNGFISSQDVQWGFITGWDNDNGPERIGTPCYAQMLLMRGYRILSFFLEKDGDMTLSRHYSQKADLLEAAIRSHFYDRQTGGFLNGYLSDGSLDARLSHHTQYWGVVCGLLGKEEGGALLPGSVLSLPHYLQNVSYEKGYEALAWARSGKSGVFVDEVLKKVFLRWLDSGHTRFPENLRVFDSEAVQLEFYDRPYGLSLCHGANGAPVLVTVLYGILGLERSLEDPLTPSFRPDLLHLSCLDATVPLPTGGVLEMHLEKDGDSVVTVPKGGRVRFSFKGKELLLEGGTTIF